MFDNGYRFSGQDSLVNSQSGRVDLSDSDISWYFVPDYETNDRENKSTFVETFI